MRAAVVYIAGGKDYCLDAVASRDSIRRHNPNLPIILATDAKSGIPPGWDRIIQLPMRRYPDMWYRDSCRFYNIAFDELYDDYDALLWTDTDVWCDDNIDDMLELANRFDLSAVHESSRHTCPTVSPIPDSFPEVNIGVMLVATNEHVRGLFRDWMELYDAHPDVYGNNDQGPLREALWINKLLNMYIMPEEFNARWGFGCCVVSRVKFLHSRASGSDPYTNERAAREINAVGGRRLFRPACDGKPAIWWRAVSGEQEYRE